MGASNTLIWIGGLIAAGGVGWYLYSKGYFDSIVETITGGLEGGGGGNGKDDEDEGKKCGEGKILCKDGKCDTQSNCDKQAKCKSDEDWNPESKKCAKKSKLAIAYVGQSGPFRAYKTYTY